MGGTTWEYHPKETPRSDWFNDGVGTGGFKAVKRAKTKKRVGDVVTDIRQVVAKMQDRKKRQEDQTPLKKKKEIKWKIWKIWKINEVVIATLIHRSRRETL